MQMIKIMAKRIKEELCDAEWYAKAALEHQSEAPVIAAVFHRLSEEELSHAGTLHDEVVALIRKTSAEKETPAVMKEIWAWQHEEIVEEEAEVRRLIDMYKR